MNKLEALRKEIEYLSLPLSTFGAALMVWISAAFHRDALYMFASIAGMFASIALLIVFCVWENINGK